jgi:hypothetical protein
VQHDTTIRQIDLADGSGLTDPLFPEANAAVELNLSPKTLQAWRVSGCGPRFVKPGRRVFYRASDLRRFIEVNTFQSTAEVDFARRFHTKQGFRS